MRNHCLGLLIAATLFPAATYAVEPSVATQNRATLYQQEVRTALTERQWRITRDEAGKLTAERRRLDQDGTAGILEGDNTFARLEIDFRADGKNRTVPSARASLCVYEPRSSYNAGYLLYPPIALRDPKLTQEYRDIVAEAELRLAVGHSAKVAME